jgi:tRNA(fMet)-specific endonuclease VapC
MRYLIDTNIIIPYLADDAATIALMRQLAIDGLAVSVISYLEAYQGVIESPTPESAREKFEAFFGGIPILLVTPTVARECAILRSMLKRQGRSVRPRALDLIIAATAIEHGLELVTRNIDDYKDITGLRLSQH